MSFVKSVTTKPVVTVGRFTSPETMTSQVRLGIVDFIGAARPSIADPFLPNKILEGHADDIRECIGCNICVSGDFTQSPIRCTQNPTMGEEWRRGWHPETMNRKGDSDRVLVVGAGPAGLEAALALGQRGYEVSLADSGEGGGRAVSESTLPGFSSYRRVADYRMDQIQRLVNVHFYPGSEMDADSIRDFGADHVALATGAHWRRDGVGRATWRPVDGVDDHPAILTPDDILAGQQPEHGPVVIYDDDHYYLGGVIAELIAQSGQPVTLVTPGPEVSHWTQNTMEQHRIEQRLIESGVDLVCKQALAGVSADAVEIRCITSERRRKLPCAALVLVTARLPENTLYFSLAGTDEDQLETLPFSLTRVGDCMAPGTIAAAVYHGHRYARELDALPDPDGVPFKREYSLIQNALT